MKFRIEGVFAVLYLPFEGGFISIHPASLYFIGSQKDTKVVGNFAVTTFCSNFAAITNK